MFRTSGAALVVAMVLVVMVTSPVAGTGVTCGGEPATIVGSHGNDVLHGTTGPDVIVAMRGADVIYAKGGDDTICAGNGVDIVYGGAGRDVIIGGKKNDELNGGSGNDVIRGGDGHDHVTGGRGADTLRGNAGGDTILGGRGNDVLYGGAWGDTLRGGTGGDVLYGNEADDDLHGGWGSDDLRGGLGTDTCAGGLGGNTASSCTSTDVYTVDTVLRPEWGAAPPQPGLVDHEIELITIHHAGTATGTVGPEQFLGWQAYHFSLGWPDIAYHFIVGRDSLTYEARDWTKAGDTATAYDPAGHLLIVVEGYFEEDIPTAGQLEHLAIMVAWGMERFDVGAAGIGGHRDHAATTCPGEHLYAHITDGSIADRALEVAAEGVTVVVR